MASSSAITTRVGTVALQCSSWSGGGDEPVEQVVLGEFELPDLGEEIGMVAAHGIGVALGLVVLLLRERRLGHQRSEPSFVGLLRQVGELLLGDGEIAL